MTKRSESPEKLKPQWFQILLALADRERHGLGIRKEVLANTDGQVKLWPAMLYGSLKQMVEAGLIAESERDPEEAEGDPRRFYRITEEGREALAAELNRLAGYIQVAQDKRVYPERAR